MNNEYEAENKAILLHDLRATMVNHSGLQHEVQVSLQQLTELLRSITPDNDVHADAGNAMNDEPIRSRISEIFEEDIDQCLPMLQLSSEKLTVLLNRFVSSDQNDLLRSDSIR